MTVILKGKKSIHMGAQAFIVEDAKEIASASWANKAMVNNDAYKWVLGRFVEADNANSNGQMWSHDDLVMANPTIQYSPMNMLHQSRNVVGAFVGSEMIYPQGDQAQVSNAYIEALGVFWKAYHPDAYAAVQRAHEEGKLFYSMECVAESVQFTNPADGSQSEVLPYVGSQSETYGEWASIKGVTRQLIKPHFLGGALIIPPVNPGWANAEVTDLSALMNDCSEELDETYKQLAAENPQLDHKELESITLELLRRESAGDSSEYSISDDKPPTSVVIDKTLDDKDNIPSEGGDMTTYSQEQADAMIAEALAPVKAELETLKAQADAEAVETQIASLKEQYEAEMAEVRSQLDAKVLEVEAAQSKYDELVAMLEAAEAEATEAAEKAARLDARVAAVAEVANFPEDHVQANAQRWASMDDETFAGLLVDYAAAVEAAKAPKKEKVSDDTLPDTSALNGTSREEASRQGSAITSSLLSELRHVDFSTLS